VNRGDFLSIVYGGTFPGLVIQTKKSSSQILGVDDKGDIEYLLRNSYKKKISHTELLDTYNELSYGKITTSQIRKITGNSRTSNASLLKWMLTNFGLAIQDGRSTWIASWKPNTHFDPDSNATLALLDRTGKIIRVNKAWSDFALENGGDNKLSDGVGLNYLDVCKGASSDDGDKAYEGIKSVIDDSKSVHLQHYPCHSPTSRRLYFMLATEFSDKYIRISHESVKYPEPG